MTGTTPDQDPDHEPLPDPAMIPRWVPVLIGIILATMAGLAVFTGFRYHDTGTLTGHVRPRRDRVTTPAPPGEPGAGASLVFHGESGETAPAAGTPVDGSSRLEFHGGREGVEVTTRLRARRGMMLRVTPRDAMVFVNGVPIGQASQFDAPDEVYDFAQPGSYTVRIVASAGGERTFVVTATESAVEDVAVLETRVP